LPRGDGIEQRVAAGALPSSPSKSEVRHDSSTGHDVMTIELNHTIVYSRDKRASSDFLANLFGLPAPAAWGPFLAIEAANHVTLDFLDADGEIAPQHYCFLVGEEEFDQIFGRIQEQGLSYWADPGHRQPGEINTHDGGRGVYFDDPSGHILEIITRPYGKDRG
jgi:catechol 2,3-dioxygenase-like lactoylglutathione lyase family enzyme